MTYVYGAGALLVAVLVAALLWYRGESIAAKAERDRAWADLRVAVEANRTNLDTIAKLRAEAEANDRLAAELVTKLDDINRQMDEANKALGELGDANEDVRGYLDTLVPDDLQRLLNR